MDAQLPSLARQSPDYVRAVHRRRRRRRAAAPPRRPRRLRIGAGRADARRARSSSPAASGTCTSTPRRGRAAGLQRQRLVLLAGRRCSRRDARRLPADGDRPDPPHRERGARAHGGAARPRSSEREVAEAALRDSEQRFRNILDNVPIGVIYTNLAGDVIQANPRFCELTGYSENELLTLRPARLDPSRRRRPGVEMGRAAGARRDPDVPRPQALPRPRAARRSGSSSTVSLLRDSQNAAVAHRRRGRGHHRAPAARGGGARARGRRGLEPRQERLPLAHEPRAAHAAERDARLRAAARARPAPSAEPTRSGRGWRRSSRPAGTCSR